MVVTVIVMVTIIIIIIRIETGRLEKERTMAGPLQNPQVCGLPTCVLSYTFVDLMKYSDRIPSLRSLQTVDVKYRKRAGCRLAPPTDKATLGLRVVGSCPTLGLEPP